MLDITEIFTGQYKKTLMKITVHLSRYLCALISFFAQNVYACNSEAKVDVVVYGGTSAGVTAAVQVAKMGKSVVLISPNQHLGGMTSNGLGWVDINRPKAIGGLAHTYFSKVWEYYQRPSSWIWEPQHPIKGQLMKLHPKDKLMWVLEPHVGEKIFNEMVSEANILVVRNERLNRIDGVLMVDQRILQIKMESGRTFTGKMFIDATYEGDLMAASKISFIVGREPNTLYNETINGMHPNISFNQLHGKIDPYVVKGNPSSGLLPRIYQDAGGNPGAGDKGVPSYNYRMCLTDVPENRVFIEKPSGYNEREYEILFRAIESNYAIDSFFKLDLLPNHKTDSNNKGLISTDYIGMSWDYAEADYSIRKQIAGEHELWQRGLLWTLQHHHRVPAATQAYYASWGLPKDEFKDNNHWPYELYVREARRMVSTVVLTEHTVLGNVPIADSIGLASYNIDSHCVRYIVTSRGFLGTDGGIYKRVLDPFPISYQAIVPLRNECENLFVPVCLSASHVAYGSIRVEPTFMILGQSAGTAASLAIDLDVAVQDVPYTILQQKLLVDGQVLERIKGP